MRLNPSSCMLSLHVFARSRGHRLPSLYRPSVGHDTRSHTLDSRSLYSVLLRQFDRLSDIDSGRPWLPCPLKAWCGNYHLQWPSSVVNKHVRVLYQDSGGLVLDSSLVQIFCTYYTDGNSMARTCGGGPGDGSTCIPGCAPVGHLQCLSVDCNCWDCSFPPTHTREAMQAQLNSGIQRHNELIIDTRTIEQYLPRVVLGFFYFRDEDDEAAGARRRFLRAYDLHSTDAPLIRVDFGAGPGEVFSLGPS